MNLKQNANIEVNRFEVYQPTKFCPLKITLLMKVIFTNLEIKFTAGLNVQCAS